MSFKRILLFVVSALSISLIVIGLAGKLPKAIVALPFVGTPQLHSLTGIEGMDAPVLVVKIDDTTLAHPQQGLKDADVVYIEQVEGGLTRLAAVFSSHIPEIVGPVRSARISDIELFSQYGKVGFAFSGAQRKFLPVIAAANLYDLGANKFGPKFYANDPARIAPYAMMLKSSELMAEAKVRGATPEISKSMGWSFGDLPSSARTLQSAHISWPASSYDANWSVKENRWLLTHNGNIDTDESGYQLGPENIIIQIVSVIDSIYKDKVGGVTPFSATVGSGDCYLLRDGTYTPCFWSRPDESSGTSFTDRLGKEIHLTPGQSWFALTSKEPILTGETLQDATKSSSK